MCIFLIRKINQYVKWEKYMKLLKIKHFDYLIALAGYFAIAFAILAGTLMSPGTIGFFHDWFIGPFP